MFTPRKIRSLESELYQRLTRAITAQKPETLSEVSADSLETVSSLFQNPLDDPGIVVTETEVMIQGREAISLTRFLHLVQLRNLEIVVLDGSPIVARRVHGEARGQTSIYSNNQ